MRKIMILIFMLFLSVQISFAQKAKTPKNINKALIELTLICPDSLKTIIINTNDDELYELRQYIPREFNEKIYFWTIYYKSKIGKHLISNGFSTEKYRYTVIFIALKKQLLGEPVNEKEIFEPYQKIINEKKVELKIPKNINEAIIELDLDCPDSLKTIIKNTDDDKLHELCRPWGKYEKINSWTTYDNKKKSEIEKYLISNGISLGRHHYTVILVAFKKYLLGEHINEKEIFEPYQKIENKTAEEEKIKYTTDSLNGVYIPKDLEDCFKQIDSFWADSTKTEIKQWTEEEFCRRAHFGFGMWMRNNWGLWRGSRLSKCFNEMGIFHPDDMSGIILTSYHRYLTEKEIKLEEQIKHYQEY